MTDNNKQDKDQAGSSTSAWIPAVIVLLVIGLAYLGVKSMGSGGSGPKRQNVKIAVLPDTPPPPPPPKEEKPPEPEKQEDRPVPQDVPKPQEAPPEAAAIKMEGAAGDGESAFQSGGVSTEYQGGDPNGNGGGGGPVNRMQFGLFANQLKRHIQAALAKDREIKGHEYQLKVRVWLDKDGSFQRVELDSSSGDAELDQALTRAFKRLPPVSAVPADLPQPALLRLTNRMAG